MITQAVWNKAIVPDGVVQRCKNGLLDLIVVNIAKKWEIPPFSVNSLVACPQETQNYRKLWVGRDPKDHLFPTQHYMPDYEFLSICVISWHWRGFLHNPGVMWGGWPRAETPWVHKAASAAVHNKQWQIRGCQPQEELFVSVGLQGKYPWSLFKQLTSRFHLWLFLTN